ncbi:imidazolonepropionase [Mesonia phycicola]|uniref:Imidazolonepropionase n=1 Tax=Mesonia phycicola TaxID=579105 RepID=A0A1M6E2I3_9FLAO|nr:imidazolonepropionase [Mesonia phycicola]SHI79712.1 imidazolonepropionase [Mesonia phycicola]
MKTLIKNIKELIQVRENNVSKLSGKQMSTLPTISNAWLLIKDDIIEDYGKMESLPSLKEVTVIDAAGKTVLPSWIDSHTHLVYAGNREQEFVDRIKGLSYEEIAAKGGGIINSTAKLQQASEDQLFEQASIRLEQVIKMGTGAIEIKSGYGLTTEAELKMLRVAKRLQKHYPITIKTTFLGAHAVPKEFQANKKEYVNEVCNVMLPKIAEENLADYIDIFCEKGYFDLEDTKQVLEAGKKYGIRGKIHVNQFNAIGGVQLGVDYDVLSVDHLEVMKEEDIDALKNTNTMPVGLPSCSLYIDIPYAPTRKMIDAGLPVALATDYNPGSSPNGNMNLVISLACIKMGMTPEEAINASTINAAYAMGIEKTHGSITKGKKANLIITDAIPSYGFLPYSFGNNHISQVILAGKIVE